MLSTIYASEKVCDYSLLSLTRSLCCDYKLKCRVLPLSSKDTKLFSKQGVQINLWYEQFKQMLMFEHLSSTLKSNRPMTLNRDNS